MMAMVDVDVAAHLSADLLLYLCRSMWNRKTRKKGPDESSGVWLWLVLDSGSLYLVLLLFLLLALDLITRNVFLIVGSYNLYDDRKL